MKKLYFFIFTSFLFSIFISCNSNENQQADENHVTNEVMLSAPVQKDEKPEPITASEKVNPGNKKIIKDGSISIEAKDIQKSKTALDTLLRNLNAYYEKEELENDEQTMAYRLKVRIPSSHFERFISSLEKGGDEIKNKSIQARDVTEEFVDIESRLVSKRQYLARYQALLAKAKTIKEILEIEENIRTIQEEIESREGRLTYLKDQVAFSTLDVHLYKDKEFIYKPGQQHSFWERVKKAVGSGWQTLVEFILLLVNIWPFLIIIVAVIFGLRRLGRRRKGNKHFDDEQKIE